MSKAAIKARITKALRRGITRGKKQIPALIPLTLTAGKLYEAYVLGLVCQRLRFDEQCTLTLVGSTKLQLKSSPGPINAAYPRIRVTRNGVHLANIWTDIEFTSYSAAQQAKAVLGLGEYHELDIAVVSPQAQARPLPGEVFLAVECKNTGYEKGLLRETLGLRRELSLLKNLTNSAFNVWPRAAVPADPPSCIAVYCTDKKVLDYSDPGAFFGIDFFHEPL